ncbi:HAD family hydrolase [Sphingomonas sp. PB4P5]|uniref:HAD family hydrolase n=1 Tax=Parasphingomonas puruogangriensis TaxID=3096155 RepID=UPI002FC78725
MIRHIIFDLDGTLVDSCATCVDILSDILVERGSGQTIDLAAARAYMSRGGLEMVAGLLGPACADPASDLADFRARYRVRDTPMGSVYPGVAEGLYRLQAAGFILSICSNKPQELCEKVLSDTGLADHFALVIGAQAGRRPKPAPDLLAATLAGLGAVPAECLFVGDSELDYQIARDARIPFNFLTYGYAEDGWLPAVGATFDSFRALTETLLAQHVDA